MNSTSYNSSLELLSILPFLVLILPKKCNGVFCLITFDKIDFEWSLLVMIKDTVVESSLFFIIYNHYYAFLLNSLYMCILYILLLLNSIHLVMVSYVKYSHWRGTSSRIQLSQSWAWIASWNFSQTFCTSLSIC